MKICICGWYFEPGLLKDLKNLNEKFPVTIVANRDRLPEEYKGVFNYHVRENRGLEYGAYDYYLKNVWDGEDVLFMHDDATLRAIIRDYVLVGPVYLFELISNIDKDLVYIFKNESDKLSCLGIHGRVMFASGRFLKDLKEINGGFPWDRENDGHTLGATPEYCKHYNWAVEELKKFWEVRKLVGCRVDSIIVPAINYHIRGRK